MLEATVLCVDNTQYSRNGDFPRTRFEAQIDAIEYIFQAKRNSNLESTLALVSSASGAKKNNSNFTNGNNHVATPTVLSTFTSQFGKILAGLNDTMIQGDHIDLINTVEMAALTLKHRQNKLQHCRIVMFICSPLQIENNEILTPMINLLRDDKIALDIINFGEIDKNTQLLSDLVDILNRNNTAGDDSRSHLLTIRPGPRLLYEHIATSPIILEESDAAAAAAMMDGNGGGAGNDGGFMDFGVDPELDPELAMALRLSMEEEQQRQERLRQQEQQQQENNNNNNNNNGDESK